MGKQDGMAPVQRGDLHSGWPRGGEPVCDEPIAQCDRQRVQFDRVKFTTLPRVVFMRKNFCIAQAALLYVPIFR